MKDYTCIIPWSGGVESTALMCHAIEQGEKPYAFHLIFNGHWKQQVTAVKAMSEELGVPVHFVRIDMPHPYTNPNKIKDYYANWGNTSPMYINWMNIAQIIHFHNPFITKIWSGRNLNESDIIRSKEVRAAQRSIEMLADVQGIPVKVSCPLENLTKEEQFNMIPDEVRRHIATCVAIDNHGRPCGKCKKCHEFKEMLKKV